MLLGDVLKVLAEQAESLGYTRTDIYELLFRGILDERSFHMEDIVKQLFSGGRPLKAELMRQLCRPEGFDRLCENIRTGYLAAVGNYAGLYDSLSDLLARCPYMRAEDVHAIAAASDAASPAGLSRMIAACLVCGSYHTAQHKKAAPKLGAQYGLNLDYMRLGVPETARLQKASIWKAAQANFLASRRKGGRFFQVDIIQRLLPQGYLSSGRFLSRGTTEDGQEAPLEALCSGTEEDVAIVGDGGIGKTTFLQHLLEKEFLLPDGAARPLMGDRPVPIFIELNRCPEHIGDWYDRALSKTNFITRYIGQMWENHATLDSVAPETLLSVEKELQRIPAEGRAQYLLLLDGFNEVRADTAIRACLSNEISVLHSYPNVRIITTSRETQAAYYAAALRSIRVVGLKRADIAAYLESCRLPEPVIGNAMACEPLVRCLRIPLYLCMFSASQTQTDFLPETAGEILYCFFHRNSAFYNARARFAETQAGREDSRKLAFILDFVLPYIGWSFEHADAFSMSDGEFRETISEAMGHIKSLIASSAVNPFGLYQYSGPALEELWSSFYDGAGHLDVSAVLSAVYDYLGIVYRYEINEGPFSDRIRYAFCHHHFRDYFSAMWDVRLLSMLQCVPPERFFPQAPGVPRAGSYADFLARGHWPAQKTAFISEILMEHRNRPRLDTETQNWYLPEAEYDEQRVCAHALDFCRSLHQLGAETGHLLPNLLAAMLHGRKELSGLDLSGLDLRGCSLFNITCSRPGRTRRLAARFDSSRLSAGNFQPEDHQNSVMEYIYCGKQCFTIDDAGWIKCWDVLSGRLEYQLQSGDPLGMTDFSIGGYLKVSRDGRFLGAKVQETGPDGVQLLVNLFDLTQPDMPPKQLRPAPGHSLLSYFAFTEDCQSVLLLCDRRVVYCVDIETGAIRCSRSFALYRESALYADTADGPIYAFTAEYGLFETEDLYARLSEEDADYSSDEDMDEEFPEGIPCELCLLTPETGEKHPLYFFVGKPGTSPTVSYFPRQKCFLLYNYDGNHIERFDCETGERTVLLEELTEGQDTPPAAFFPHPDRDNACYVMYPDVCFSADLRPGTAGRILMRYAVSAVEKLLPDSDQSGELAFRTAAAPAMHRFVVGNDANTYEWDTENDTLTRKYNCVYYECTALFTNPEKSCAILVHRHNGVSLFGGEPVRLEKQYCFRQPEYLIDIACLEENSGILALAFARPDHEKVVLLDLVTGLERTVYSTFRPGEAIESLCFSGDGKELLITTQYQCLACETVSGGLQEVAQAGRNERLAAGHYVGDEIEIAVVEHAAEEEPRVQPYCIFYRRGMESGQPAYLPVWYYLMPALQEEQFPYFIYQSGDLGTGGSNNSEGFQQYWVTRGFFLEQLPGLAALFRPRCYALKGGRRIRVEKQFRPLDMLFVRHSRPLTNRYGVGDSGISYLYLGEEQPEAILTDNRECLSYHKDLRELDYRGLREAVGGPLQEGPDGAYWDYAIPWHDGSLIGCYAFYRLARLRASDNQLLEQIEYEPGISVIGCTFRHIDADDETKGIIRENGGML